MWVVRVLLSRARMGVKVSLTMCPSQTRSQRASLMVLLFGGGVVGLVVVMCSRTVLARVGKKNPPPVARMVRMVAWMLSGGGVVVGVWRVLGASSVRCREIHPSSPEVEPFPCQVISPRVRRSSRSVGV